MITWEVETVDSEYVVDADYAYVGDHEVLYLMQKQVEMPQARGFKPAEVIALFRDWVNVRRQDADHTD